MLMHLLVIPVAAYRITMMRRNQTDRSSHSARSQIVVVMRERTAAVKVAPGERVDEVPA
jgi:hypothetical protein